MVSWLAIHEIYNPPVDRGIHIVEEIAGAGAPVQIGEIVSLELPITLRDHQTVVAWYAVFITTTY